MDSLRVTVGLTDDEYDGDYLDVEHVEGLRREELDELLPLLPVGAVLSTSPGSVGKGAAGPGAVLEIGHVVLSSGADFITWGLALLEVFRSLKRRKADRTLNLDDPKTIAAVAAAQAPELHDRLRGTHFIGTYCLTGCGPGIGVDLRDTWASSFGSGNGWLVVLYISPSGLFLGSTIVPGEWDPPQGRKRSQEEINRLFRQTQVQPNA